jgi:hypothetical protein
MKLLLGWLIFDFFYATMHVPFTEKAMFHQGSEATIPVNYSPENTIIVT